MKLSPMQLFTQEKIILASHPGLSLEEAKEAELNTKGCIVKYYRDSYRGEEISEYQVIKKMEGDIIFGNIGLSSDVDNPEYRTIYHNLEEIETESYKIIGLPPTLPRVVKSLKDTIEYIDMLGVPDDIRPNRVSINYISKEKINYIDWLLLNEDGTDATLRDQSEETQEKIALLLGWKDE